MFMEGVNKLKYLKIYIFIVAILSLSSCEAKPIPKKLNVKAIKQIKSAPVEYPISFLATGDVFTYISEKEGLFVKYHKSDDLTEQLYKQVGQFSPAPVFFLINGDISHGTPEQIEYHLDTLRKYTGPLPVLHTVGNHEHDTAVGLETFNSVIGPENYDFVYGNTHFIMINTGGGTYGPDEMPDESIAFLESRLSQSTSDVKVVCFHIPPFNDGHYQPAPYWSFKNNEERFVSLMSQYHVTLAVCAHWTGYDIYKKDKTTYVTTAGGGLMLVPEATPGEKLPPSRGHFHHFTGFSIHKDGRIDVKVYEVNADPAKQGHDERFDAVIEPLNK